MNKNAKFGYKRINVVGTSNCGKTTFGKNLSNIVGIDHIEMDELFWGPDWYWPSDDEFFLDIKFVRLRSPKASKKFLKDLRDGT